MRCLIEIRRKHLLANLEAFRVRCPDSLIAPVVKSNAYGHGLREIVAILQESPSLPWLCVNYLAEAQTLRNALGYPGRILIVGPLAARDIPTAAALDADLVVGHEPLLQAWEQASSKPRLHLKIDTGMSRQGFWPENLPALMQRLAANQTGIAGICTHFANVEDVLKFDYPLLQLAKFRSACELFCNAFPKAIRHASSSASSLILPESRLDLCRVGISLYGQWPSELTRVSYLQQNSALLSLSPVLSWKTEVDSLKDIAKGSYVGYGCTFRAPQAMRLAILPLGYAEGYPRLAGENKAHVLLQGSRCQIIGRICMNMMMIDVSHLDQVRPGEEVTLIGQDGEEILTGADLGDKSRTIDYEILSRLHPDIPKRILD